MNTPTDLTPWDLAHVEGLFVTRKPTRYHETPVPTARAGRRLKAAPSSLRFSIPEGPKVELPAYGRERSAPTIEWQRVFRDRFTQQQRLWRLTGATGSIEEVSADQLAKAGPESGACPGWYVPDSTDHLNKVDRLDPMIVKFVASLMSRPSDEQLAAPQIVKTGTNHGDPTWRKSLNDHAVHILMAAECSNPADISRVLVEARALAGAEDLPPVPLLTTFSRTGGTAKPQTIRAWVDGRLHDVGECTGLFPRRRHVRGVPTFLNEIARAYVQALTDSLKQHYFYQHTYAGNSQLKLKELSRRMELQGLRPRILSDDISGFDVSVPSQHLRQTYEAAPGLTRLLAFVFETLTTNPVISGPLVNGDAGFIFERDGVLPSGSIDTALTGTRINLSVIIDCYAAGMGWSISDSIAAFQQSKWGVLLLGDDTCLVVDDHIDRDAYVKRAAELGYKRRLEEYPVFLMTWLNPNGPPFGLSARAAIRTASREHLAAGPITELLGAYVRWARCVGDPTFEAHWQLVADNPLFEEYRVHSFQDLESTCRAPWVEQAFLLEVASPQGPERWEQLLKDLEQHTLSGVGRSDRAMALLQKLGGLRDLASKYADRDTLLSKLQSTSWRSLLKSEYAEPLF